MEFRSLANHGAQSNDGERPQSSYRVALDIMDGLLNGDLLDAGSGAPPEASVSLAGSPQQPLDASPVASEAVGVATPQTPASSSIGNASTSLAAEARFKQSGASGKGAVDILTSALSQRRSHSAGAKSPIAAPNGQGGRLSSKRKDPVPGAGSMQSSQEKSARSVAGASTSPKASRKTSSPPTNVSPRSTPSQRIPSALEQRIAARLQRKQAAAIGVAAVSERPNSSVRRTTTQTVAKQSRANEIPVFSSAGGIAGAGVDEAVLGEPIVCQVGASFCAEDDSDPLSDVCLRVPSASPSRTAPFTPDLQISPPPTTVSRVAESSEIANAPTGVLHTAPSPAEGSSLPASAFEWGGTVDFETQLRRRAQEAEEQCGQLEAQLLRQSQELNMLRDKIATIAHTQPVVRAPAQSQARSVQTDIHAPDVSDMTALAIGRPGADILCSPPIEQGSDGTLDVFAALRHTLEVCGPSLLSAASSRAAEADSAVPVFGDQADAADAVWAEVLLQQSAQISRLAKESHELRAQTELRHRLLRVGAHGSPGKAEKGVADVTEARAEARDLRCRVEAQRLCLDHIQACSETTATCAGNKLEIAAVEEALARFRARPPHSAVLSALDSSFRDCDGRESTAAHALRTSRAEHGLKPVAEALLLEGVRLRVLADVRQLSHGEAGVAARLRTANAVCSRMSAATEALRTEAQSAVCA